jgi:hypothetical protein
MTDLINDSLQLGINLYQKQLENGYVYKTIPLDCSVLRDPPVSKDQMHPEFFGALHGIFEDSNEINRRACLYIMEIVSPETSVIEKAYRAYKVTGSSRNSSAIKNSPDLRSSYLYIGKVKQGIGGRIASHLGYANARTGALQLVHWAKAIGLKLIVHVHAFDHTLDDFVNPLELTVSKRLHPIIGKSK